MRQIFGMSRSGNLSEAVDRLENPQFVMLMSNNAQFETHVRALEKMYPGVPSIGCIGMSYDTSVVEEGVGIIAFVDGVTATANVLEQVSTMPIRYIERLEEDVRRAAGTSPWSGGPGTAARCLSTEGSMRTRRHMRWCGTRMEG